MKYLLLLSVAALCATTAPVAAQNCGTGSTLTHYLGGNGNEGVMFDITPSVDMAIECIDVNTWNISAILDVSFHYTVGTCVGVGTNPTAWVQFASVTGVAGGAPGTATKLDISGNGQVFSAGQTYGIYVECASAILAYTAGASTLYSGTHCDLLTHFGSEVNWGGINPDRVFNGELHTEEVFSGPMLSLGGTCPGAATVDVIGLTPSGLVAFYYALAAGNAVVPNGACAGLALPVSTPTQIAILVADGLGNASLPGVLQPGHCGSVILGAVDVATCTASSLLTL